MNRQRAFLISGFVILLLVGVVVLATRHSPLATQRASSRVVYYCPMHPTYTSDRPGDCPICNMKLVHREETGPPSTVHRPPNAQQPLRDICYMHNCPMVHQGKPCPMLVVAKEGESVTCPICGTHVAEAATEPKTKKILYWTDPMIPGYRSDAPGKSPMGMDLVPVYEEGQGPARSASGEVPGYAPILVSPQKRQLIGVTTGLAQRRAAAKTIRVAGRIAYDPELYQAQQEYLQAVQALEQARAGGLPEVTAQAEGLLEASRTRLRLMGLSDALLEEMRGWEGPDRRLLLSGEGSVWLYAAIYEYELPLVSVGQTMTAQTPAFPGKTFQGIVKAIDPVLDPVTRSARVRTLLADPDGLLRPEMYVNAMIEIPLGEVLTVPQGAVMRTGTQQIVFVDKGQGIFEPRQVTLGAAAEGFDEIIEGVQEGERVVTSGNFLIDSESRLKAALQGMGGQEHHHGQTSP